MAHRVSVIDRTTAKTYEWLERLCEKLGSEDRQHAYMVLRAVLHALRDRIGPEVSVHLAAQLPLLVRGIFYEGWDSSTTPQRLTLDEFLARVERDATLKGVMEAEHCTRAVIQVLWEELAPGTVEHIVAVLPGEFAIVL